MKNRHNKKNDPRLVEVAELLFFVYRDFTGDPDCILAKFGFGRAHHRALHFIGRCPGITVTGLLRILRITKQSLARVLRCLLEEGLVEQHADESDRRCRRLFLSVSGKRLLARLSAPQRRRISRALDSQKCDPFPLWRNVMLALVNDDDREHILELMSGESP